MACQGIGLSLFSLAATTRILVNVPTPTYSSSPFALTLSIVVVSADSGPSLRECVRRLLTTELALEVILVDNGSEDGIPAAIDRAYQSDLRLAVIYNRANLGFGPAVNIGARQARGRALMVLNPDCLVQEDDLKRLLAALEARPKVGLVGAVVCDENGRPDPASRRRDPLLRRALNSLFWRAGEGINIGGEIPGELIEVEALSGALMLMPRALFQRIGGFDEDYFLHCEDLDLCRRVRDFGYKVMLAGDVRVLHGKGGSSRHRPVFVSRYKHRGMWRWFRKHDPAARNPVVAGVVWLGIWSHFLWQIPRQWWSLLRRR
ncbi:MAG: glycosyltransferase family 2 protein [Rhodanobacter sp.]|nr:MAG: glycosyltransferase family 2 protein [Rhodanobacter sp.]